MSDIDLNKIPDPSEEDLKTAAWNLREVPSFWHDRVIAHILRHGSVLAETVLTECPGLIQDVPMNDPNWGKVIKAVKFFERFGGNNG